MQTIEIRNPFGSPVYHENRVNSTMDISRKLAKEGGALHGTVIVSDFQNSGRGRGQARSWEAEANGGLLFTVLLRYPSIEAIPAALTLRSGLAVALAIESFASELCGAAKIKWPNDIMLGAKKTAGLLAEADGGEVHLGVGVNVRQKNFDEKLQNKATSIAIAAGRDIPHAARFVLLEKILCKLESELYSAEKQADWRARLDSRLYKKGELVNFIEGGAESLNRFTGRLLGIGQGGELLLLMEETGGIMSFVTGELEFVYGEALSGEAGSGNVV